MRYINKLKGVAFLLWHAKHYAIHLLLGLLWAWLLRELWNQLNVRWIFFALIGSVLPDIEHLIYWLTYGKADLYTQEIIKLIKQKKWRALIHFIEQGHKYNTNLAYHNIYFVLILCLILVFFMIFDFRSWVALTGAVVIHYLYDIIDDFIFLGYINPNWKRWGREKKD